MLLASDWKIEMERKLCMLLASLFMGIVAESAVVPAIYMFGDSSADVGNNNFLPGKGPKANFAPYGIDFPGRKPTGRFSNGYVGIDYLAQTLGFEKSPPPYVSITNDAQARGGVNFASGGSGIFDATNRNVSISLNQQIRYFKGISNRLRKEIGGRAADRFLSKSLFCLSTATNDIFFFFADFGVVNQTQQDLFIGYLAGQFKNQLETLYHLGGRKFLVFGTSLVGCGAVLQSTVPGGKCVEYLNNLSQQFNTATRLALRDLADNLKGFSYSFLDIYDFSTDLSSDPLKYGFTEALSVCCGAGKFNAETDCTPTSKYCSDRNKYIFWDRYHPTQALWKTLIRAMTRGRRYASPVTIKQLVHHNG